MAVCLLLVRRASADNVALARSALVPCPKAGDERTPIFRALNSSQQVFIRPESRIAFSVSLCASVVNPTFPSPSPTTSPEAIASVLAFRPRWSVGTYGRTVRAEYAPAGQARPKYEAKPKPWRDGATAALYWLRFMPLLTITEAERVAHAGTMSLYSAMLRRPCLRAEVDRLRAFRRAWLRDWRQGLAVRSGRVAGVRGRESGVRDQVSRLTPDT